MPSRGRHARSKSRDAWGSQPGRTDERRAAADDDPWPPKRPPGKKDTRRWCKGKEGTEHQLGMTLYTGLRPALRGSNCRWAPTWDRKLRQRVVGWVCWHREACTVCGKVFREPWDLTVSDCPAYPGTLELKEAAAVALANEKAWRASHAAKYRLKPPVTGPQHYRRPRKDS